MACCSFEDFKLALLKAFARCACPSILIDWERAKVDWKRYHCTGREAAETQLRALSDDVPYKYDWLPKQQGGDGGLAVDA